MKRAILNQGSLSSLAAKSYLILALLISFSYVATAQVDCNITMACNDGLQVSLDDNCQAEITPDMMLESPVYGPDAYSVELLDLAGNPLGTNTVNGDFIDQTVQVKVTLIGCDISCWGNITVEDKLAPVINCQDITISCDQDPDDVSPPQIVDACGGPVDVSFNDEVEDQPCTADVGRIITRTYTVSDVKGNTATCVQNISVDRANIGDVVFPQNLDGEELPMIVCGTNFPTNDDGTPAPEFTGFPSNIACPNIQFYYTDVIFDVCGASQKVLRQWVVIDWCTGQEATDNQIIKVIDNLPPVCTSQPDFVDNIPTDQGLCTGTYLVPPPIVVAECSNWDYEVGYKLRDENGTPFENAVIDNVTRLDNGQYQITELPQDTTWVVYTITDDCGNSTMCFTEVFVSDQQAPNAICEGYTIVSLDDNGEASVSATSIDDFSFDNCSDVTLAVRRLNTDCGSAEDMEFGESVSLCCEDVANSPILVVLRVTDAEGNVNECIANVNVQDKYAPEITCPAEVNLNCGQDYTDMSLTGGMATADDNCGVTVEFLGYNTSGLSECGIGTVFKNFRVTDPQGRTESCSQRITITNPNPFSENDIVWPQDMDVTTCDMNDLEPEITGFPIISNDLCATIAISREDQVFEQEEGEEICFKILRTWRVIDECADDLADGNFYTFSQKITVINSVAPTFNTTCVNQNLLAADGECEANATVTVDASDDCTADADLEYLYTIDYDDDGTIDVNGNTNDASGIYPTGSHRVIFTVTDQCDNARSCESIITVSDAKAPTPYCIGNLTIVLDDDGNVELWASDINLKSIDECDGEDVTVAFDALGQQQVIFFSCADLDNGIGQDFEIDMYAIDKSGNSDFCTVTVTVQDNGNDACTDSANAMATLEGRIVNDDYEGIMAVDVDIYDMSDDNEEMTQVETNEEGAYTFSELPFYDGYMVKPISNGDHSAGVSTLDLVLIQRHILGLQDLEGSHNLIAADINGSSNISGADIVELRKVILGVSDEFSNNTAWKYIPTSFEFADPSFPWTYPTELELAELYVDTDELDFFGIKIGDVNGSATNLTSATTADTRSAGLELSIVNAEFTRGQEVNLPVIVESGMDIEGMQMTITFDESVMTYKGITSNQANIAASHINATQASRGIIAIAYDNVMGLELNSDDVLMNLEFVAVADATVEGNIDINSDVLTAEVYDLSHNTASVSLEIRNEYTTQNEGSIVLSASPNPFNDMTNIRFTLPTEQTATITILDATGRVMMNVTKACVAGENTIEVTRDQLSVDGLYYYQLETAERTIVKKMIMVK